MKVKIIRLSKKDAWYGERKSFVGVIGKFIEQEKDLTKPWKNGTFTPDKPVYPFPDTPTYTQEDFFFAYVKFEKV